MYLGSSFAVLLLVAACAVSSDGENSAEEKSNEEIALENEHINKSVFRQARNCLSDGDCLHLGKCGTTENGKFCNCINGTSGDFCETVDYCADELGMCGTSDDVSCVFDSQLEKAICKCDNDTKTYVPDEGRCMSPCTGYGMCGRDSYCGIEVGNQTFCECRLGTIGDYCEIIEACHTKKVDCGANNHATCTLGGKGKAYCKCDDPEMGFDYDEKVCKECDCGTGAQSCSYVNGDKKCICNTDYADRSGTCQPCYCKNQTSSPACYFKYYNKICQCDEGYAQRGDDCIKCDCGEKGKCSYNTQGQKECACKDGYKEDRGICKECHCGENGYCSFDSEGNKTCSCSYRFQEFEGFCYECDCGENSNCKLLGPRFKQCTCRSGYGRQYSRCTPCDCFPGNDCTFDGYYSKKCICPKGYADYRGTCKECDCQVDGANCSYVYSGSNKCQCPKGYEQASDPCIPLNSYCKDVDECKQYDVCPPSTECVNTVGSYDCVCKDGYEEYDLYDIKKDGCRDVNECVRNSRPCTDSYAKCENTPGSYKCNCQTGYTLLRAYTEESNICFSDDRPWRTATIVVGCVSGVTIFVLLLIIQSKRTRVPVQGHIPLS